MSTTQASEYTLLADLKGSKGPVNVLLFSEDGKRLLSAGDDQCVRVWSTETFALEQVLHFDRWGQVTALTWVAHDRAATEKRMAICVGGARGSLSICPFTLDPYWFQWKEVSHSFPFSHNDTIEKQAYDALNRRLVVGSHSGTIKMFALEGYTLHCLWSASTNHAVPRALAFFDGGNQSVLILTLANGEMSCRESQTSALRWVKHLNSAIGNATLSSDETSLVIDNLTTGKFDLYDFPSSTPSCTFSLESTRHFVKECSFIEGTKLAACGGYQGRVEVVDTSSGDTVQSLVVAKESNLIQTIAATSPNSNKFLIAGGVTNSSPSIYLWGKKPVRKPESTLPSPYTRFWHQNKAAVCLVLFTVIANYHLWAPRLWQLSRLALVAIARILSCIQRMLEDNPTELASAIPAVASTIIMTTSHTPPSLTIDRTQSFVTTQAPSTASTDLLAVPLSMTVSTYPTTTPISGLPTVADSDICTDDAPRLCLLRHVF